MTPNPREILVQIAKSYEGVSEIGGDNEGQQIEEFQRAVNGRASKEPWCMCFVQFCVQRAVKESKRSSQLYSSESVLEVWTKSSKFLRKSEPSPGLIVLWQMGTEPLGHCGIVLSTLNPLTKTFQTIEGNTGVGPMIERNGDGVYEKLRNRNPKGTMRLLGFLDPFG